MQILAQSQSPATKRNTKWVVNLFEGEFLYTRQELAPLNYKSPFLKQNTFLTFK